MTPKKLRLKGFKGIRSGFGRDEIALDFYAIAGDAEQIAIVAPNGKGKTTLLDNMQPYRLMPSRVTTYSPNGFSFWDVIYGPEASKEFEWEHQGKHYKQTLIFRNSGKTKKAEAYLHVFDNGFWQPASLPDGTVSDGKTETYDRCIEGILGNAETFFTSAFAAQQRKPLSAYTDGEIKTLLADLLRLSALRGIGEKANQVVKLLTAGLDGMRSGLAGLQEKESRLPALREFLLEKAQQEALRKQDRHAATEAVAAAQATLAGVKATRAAAAETEQRRASIKNRFDASLKGNADAHQQLLSDIRREESRLEALREEARRANVDAEKRIASLGELATKQRELLSKKPEIEAAIAKLPTLTETEARLALDLASLRDRLARLNTLKTQRAAAIAGIEGVTREGKAEAAIRDGLKARAGLADQVPCMGSDLQPRCPLLRETIAAKEGLPGQEAKVIRLQAQYAEQVAEVKSLDTAMAAIGDLPAQIDAKEHDLKTIAAEIKEATGLQALASQLSDAENAIRNFDAQSLALCADMERRTKAVHASEEQTAGLVKALQVRAGALVAERQRMEADIDAELASLPAPFDDHQFAAAEDSFEAEERRLTAIDLDIERMRGDLANTRATLEAHEAEIAAGSGLRRKASTIEAEIAKWIVLAKAFSNNGIIALSIDDAGPSLSGIVNDLLLACHGRRFTVSIETQTANAKGELKEGFEIMVHDAERDESKKLTDMSGGEKVWINEALTRGIALYLAQESGVRYDTLFSDEADGPLDPERKLHFMKMKREVLRLGGYNREYFISQTPELWELADARVDLASL